MILPPPFHSSANTRRLLIFAAVCTALPACRKPEITSYVVQKDEAEESVTGTNSSLEEEGPRLGYVTPTGWKDIGGDKMSAARFAIEGEGEGSVMITPLPLMAGQEPALVNMWRQQTEQPLLSPEDAAKELKEAEIAGEKGSMFEVTGKRGDSGTKIVTAFIHRDGRSWFFKLQGTPAKVDAQKSIFLEFLKGVRFDGGASTPPAPAPSPAPAPTPAPEPSPAPAPEAAESAVPGTAPADWKSAAPGAMQAAKFSVPDKDGAQAEVTVSIFPSDTGGAVANVTRWRTQIGLPEGDSAAVQESIKPLPGGPEGAVIVELENAGKALTGAIVPRDGQWFFYKLMGGTAAVTAAREAFINYCKAGS
jgi:hypothetical protein